MLRVFQTRTIQWDRGASELEDFEMTSIATDMLNVPDIWTELEIGNARTYEIYHNGRRMVAVIDCLSAEDDMHLQILSVQYI